MALYIVSHKSLTKTAEMEIFINPRAGYVERRQMNAICLEFKRLTGYKKYIHYGDLRFKEVKIAQSVEVKPDIGACDKDWCDACKKGNYERCPNQK